MLSKNKRIPRELFADIIKSSRYYNSPHFSLRVGKSEDTKVAVSVSKKVSKKAVLRNRIRRRTYSALRNIFNELKPGLYLFIAKPNTLNIKGKELESELMSLVASCRL